MRYMCVCVCVCGCVCVCVCAGAHGCIVVSIYIYIRHISVTLTRHTEQLTLFLELGFRIRIVLLDHIAEQNVYYNHSMSNHIRSSSSPPLR